MSEDKLRDIGDLRQWMDKNKPMRGNALIDTVLDFLMDNAWHLADVIEAQEARIKALEGQVVEVDEPIMQGEQRVEKRKVVTRVVDKQGVAHHVISEVEFVVIPIPREIKTGDTFTVSYTLPLNDGGDSK
jgi:hypothetical protein